MIDGSRRGSAATDEAAEDESPVRTHRGPARLLAAAGVTANQVTIVGVGITAVASVLIATGHLVAAVAVGVVGGLMDFLDGMVAKVSGSSSKQGAFLDSVSDRVADAFLLCAVAWYLASGPHPRLAVLPLGILAAGNLVSYLRAKGESLGYVAKGGLMERAERLILLGFALLFHAVLVPLLWTLLALTMVTAVQRFAKVWRQASVATPPPPPSRVIRWRPARVESRWRAFREGDRQPRRAPRTRRRIGSVSGIRRVLEPAARPPRPTRRTPRTPRRSLLGRTGLDR